MTTAKDEHQQRLLQVTTSQLITTLEMCPIA